MSLLTIVEYPDDILTTECEPVTTFDRALTRLVSDMYKTMEAADGVGLAAPQINIAKQIAVVDIGDGSGRFDLINPVILEESGEQTGIEGCLSFPGLYGDVKRAYYVKVQAQNRKGETYVLEAEDFLARAIQHEIDHLHGILFTEKVITYYEEEDLDFANE